MNFQEREKEIIIQTLNVPLKAFGYDRFEEKIGVKEIEKLKFIIKGFENLSSIEKDNLFLILKAFIYARDIIDWNEYFTITGYSWEESTDLIVRILAVLNE